MYKAILLYSISFLFACAGQPLSTVKSKPRILISTDIGGTDPDDNQSMAHLLMYNHLFDIEGLVSSPSYGSGSTREILRMIDLYEQDLPVLRDHAEGWHSPASLRSITKQSVRGNAPYKGYRKATEGSEWIAKCAMQPDERPLWILVWGGLEDVAQALHDHPDIADHIRIYWIGGPNKKWSANSYAYIVEHYPDLWFIEVNSSYYGFFSSSEIDEIDRTDYYDQHIRGAGMLGADFRSYYGGEIKMGDTPSLLYLMHGDPDDPTGDSWGGSFERTDRSSRIVFDGMSTLTDSVAFATALEYHLSGPVLDIHPDSSCFSLDVPYGSSSVQRWPGYYLGDGRYAVRYMPKKAETLTLNITSDIPALDGLSGHIIVTNQWPGPSRETDYIVGDHWYTDKADPALYDGKIQGGKTLSKWRDEVLEDWAERWSWLRTH